MITDWLPLAGVRLDFEAADWEAAVLEAGRLLVATGAARADYARAMVDTVRQLGPYIVIAPGIALPHARPEAGALRAGLSFLRLRRPVVFGHDTNDPVDLIFGLAATDSGSHVELLARLAGILGDAVLVARLRAARTPREVLAILARDDEQGAATSPPGS